jgi:hypothetical protein
MFLFIHFFCGAWYGVAAISFQLQPEEFIQILLDEMIRSGAASWHNNHFLNSMTN